MTAEQIYFLKVISDYVKGRKSNPPAENVDIVTLERIAASQNMSGIVYAQCKSFLSKDNDAAIKKLENGFVGSVFHHICDQQDFGELKNAFDEEKIELLAFKGLELAEYHRIPELRTMGDIDVLIHSTDRKAAHRLMLSLDYKCVSKGEAVWTYTRDVVRIEIHDHMIYEKLSREYDYERYFDKAWCFEKNGSLDPNMQFLFLVTHTAKHMLNRGCGFRPFLDMTFMAESGELDWQFICTELERLKLLDFARTSFAMCHRWFGARLPVECEDVSEKFFDDATEKVFSDGLFGFENNNNTNANVAKDLKRNENLGWLALLSVMLRKLFPKENTLPHMKFYSFIFSHKILRPIAWIYRFVYCTATGFIPGIKTLFYPIAKRKEIQERHMFMGNWGL